MKHLIGYLLNFVKSIYIVGSNSSETLYKVIKVNRLGDQRTLSLTEDPVIIIIKPFEKSSH